MGTATPVKNEQQEELPNICSVDFAFVFVDLPFELYQDFLSGVYRRSSRWPPSCREGSTEQAASSVQKDRPKSLLRGLQPPDPGRAPEASGAEGNMECGDSGKPLNPFPSLNLALMRITTV